MKLIVVLPILLLASPIKGDAFAPGQEYQYHYTASISSGIPGRNTQWSGLGLDYKIVFQAYSDHLIVKFNNVRSAQVNEYVNSIHNYPFDFQPKAEFSEHLSQPFKVYLVDGVVKKFYVNHDEPEWSINMKKAVLTIYQLNFRQHNPVKGSPEKSDPTSNYFRVMDDGIGGECETMYNIMEAHDAANPHNSPLMNVTKTVNHENCKHRPIIGYSNVPVEPCTKCGPEAVRNKFFNTHTQAYYMIRGGRYYNLIKTASSDGETVFSNYGSGGKSLLTYVSQTVVLDYVRPITKAITVSRRTVAVNTLTYKFHETVQFLDKVDLKTAHSIYTSYGYYADIQLLGPLFETIAKSYKDIDLEENLKHNYTTKYAELVKHFATLSYDKINRLYKLYANFHYDKATPEERAKVNLFLNILNDVGSNPSYIFAKELIRTKRITPSQAAAYFTKLSFALKEPTKILLDDLQEFCSHEEVTKHENVKRACYLSFAGIVHANCVRAKRLELGRVSILDRTCTPEIADEYVENLQQKYDQSHTPGDKTLYLLALGGAGAKKSISFLEPIVKGIPGQPLYLRYAASWALFKMAKPYPEEVMAVVSPVMYNKTEDHEIRIICLTVFIETRPTLYHYYDLAKTLRYDKNRHLKNYLWTTIQYLSNSTHPCHAEIGHNARRAFEILKASNYTPIYSPKYSFFYLNGGYSQKYNYGGYTSVEYVANNVSYIPRSVHFTVENYYLGYSTKPLEFGFRTRGLDKIIDKIFGPDGIFYTKSAANILDPKPRPISKEVKEIEEALSQTPRQYENVFGFMYMLRYGQLISQFSFHEGTFQDFFSQNTSPVPNLLALLKNGIKYHNQLYTMAIDRLTEVPTEIGLPIIFHGRLPTQTSLNIEHAKLQVHPAVLVKDRTFKIPTSVEIEANAKLSTDSVEIYTLSVLSPAEKLQYGTGFEFRTMSTVPIKGSIKYDVPTRKFDYEYEPLHENVFRAAFEPFTYIDNYADVTVLQEDQNYSPTGIHRFHHESESEYGQDYLGVGLQVNSKYYGYFYDRASYANFIQQHTFPSMVEYFMKNPHYRPYQFQVKVTPAATRRTQKLVGSVQLKYHDLASNVAYSPVYAEHDLEFERHSKKQHSRRPQTISVVAHMKTIGSVERKLNAEFVYQWTLDNLYHRIGFYAKRTPFTVADSNTKYCINALVQKPRKDWKHIVQLRSADIDTKANTKIHIGWGSDCTSDKTIEIALTDDRNEEQLRYINQIPLYRSHFKAHSFPFYEIYPYPAELGYNPYVLLYYRCVTQASNGYIMNRDCWEYIQKTTETRKHDLKINYKNIPEYFSNVALKLHSMYNYKVFPHIDFSFYSGNERPAGEITIKANASVHYPVLDVEVKLPQTTFNYQRLYLSSYLPPASTYLYGFRDGYFQQYWTNYKDFTYVTCTIDKFIHTFSNTLYEPHLTDCYHVVSKDCSESREYTVLMRKSTSNPRHKDLRVILRETSIEMIPTIGAVKVRVDGKAVTIQETEPYFHYRQLGSHRIVDFVIRTSDKLYFIDAPQTGLYIDYDSSNAAIFVSNYYVGKMCGMCGITNGMTRTVNVRLQSPGPDECFHINTTVLALSYAVKTPQCTIPKFPKPLVCDFNNLLRAAHPERVCAPLRNRVIYRDDIEGLVCFSTKPFPECRKGCKPTRILTRNVGFHCLRSASDDDYAQRLIGLRTERVLYELDQKKEDIRADINYPEDCGAE